MGLVTIAIPVYNGMPYIKYAIQSVINQTYKDWILYLINDGSTDDSLEIMQQFANSDNRIKIINDNLNKGLAQRLNESIRLTKTKYYSRMDADDIMCITRIEDQINFLETHPEIDVLGSSIMTIDNNNSIVGSGFSEGIVNSFFHPTITGKTSWFSENLYNITLRRVQDFELWCRTSSTSNFYSLGKPLLFYREFGVPSLNKTLQSLKTILRVSSKYKQYNKPFSWFIKLSSQSILKMIIYSLFGIFGKMDYIVSKRRRTPIPTENQLTEEDLNKSIS